MDVGPYGVLGMRRKLSTVILSMLLVFVLAACGAASPFVGTWVGWVGEPSKNAVTYTFLRGGEGFFREMRGMTADGFLYGDLRFETPFNWSATEEQLEIHFEGSKAPLIYYFEFLDEENVVITRDTWPGAAGWLLMRLEE